MTCKMYTDAVAFYHDTVEVLAKHEPQNSLPLGNAKRGAEGWDTTDWFMATITDEDGHIVLTAVMTPPHNLTLYATNNVIQDDALRLLARTLIDGKIPVPGINTEDALAERFTALYTELTEGSYEQHKRLRIYVLDKVDEQTQLIGTLRLARAEDMSFLPYWVKGFHDDCFPGTTVMEDAYKRASDIILRNVLYILEVDGVAVSMASMARETVRGRCIGLVYTPPYFRKKGYASSCAAQVSQKILDKGYAYSMLFADLANPISNSIYQKMAYKQVCDVKDIRYHDYLTF